MSVQGSKAQLTTLTKELLGRWEQTKEHWLDARSHDFENKYLAPLESQVTTAAAAIDKLDKLISKVRSDCE